MEHDELAAKITDWVRGTLREPAEELSAHVRGCPDCQASADAARALEAARQATAQRSAAHPSSDELAAYVVAAPQESMATLAVVGWHLRDCADCRGDADLLRAAAHAGFWRRVRSTLRAAPWTNPVLAPALAASLLLLAYPAWQGLRSGGGDRLAGFEGGPVRALVLRETPRADGPLPRVQLTAGQMAIPLLLDTAPRSEQLAVRLFREPNALVWSFSGSAEQFWDADNQVVGVLVPAAILQPGEYRIELSDGLEPAWFQANFRVGASE